MGRDACGHAHVLDAPHVVLAPAAILVVVLDERPRRLRGPPHPARPHRESASAAPDSRLGRARALGPRFLAILPFLNGLPADFTYDDKLIISGNERIASPSKVDEIFTTQYFGGSLASAQNYRPVLLLTYAVQRWIHGNRAWLFRAVNILLHAAATIFLAAWLVELGFAARGALAAGSLFAVFTIHVEAVTSLVGRAELLAALLVLAVARLWLRATADGRLRARPYAAALGVFLVSVFVKENAIVAPGVVVLGELFRGGRGRSPREAWTSLSRAARLAFAGFLGPIVVLFAVRIAVIHGFLVSREAGIFDLEPAVALKPGLRSPPPPSRVPTRLMWCRTASRRTIRLALPLAADWRSGAPCGCGVRPGALARDRVLAAPAARGADSLRRLALPGLQRPVRDRHDLGRTPRVPSVEPRRRWPSWACARGPASFARAVEGDARRGHSRGVAAAVRNLAPTTGRSTATWSRRSRTPPRRTQRRLGRPGRRARPRSSTPRAPWRSSAVIRRVGALETALDERSGRGDRCYRRSIQIFPSYERTLGPARSSRRRAGWTGAEREPTRARILPDSTDRLPPGGASRGARAIPRRPRTPDDADNGDGAPSVRLAHARILVRLGRESEAWDEARWALVADPSNADARRFLAERYEASGRSLAAGAERARAVRSNPADEESDADLLEYALRQPSARSRAQMLVPDIRKAVPAPGPRLAKALRDFG